MVASWCGLTKACWLNRYCARERRARSFFAAQLVNPHFFDGSYLGAAQLAHSAQHPDGELLSVHPNEFVCYLMKAIHSIGNNPSRLLRPVVANSVLLTYNTTQCE